MTEQIVSRAAFPRAFDYVGRRRPAARMVREGEPDDGFPYTERHLQCVWFDARLRPPDLATAAGEPVRVESPGRWNLEAGPDFLDAALSVGADRRRLQGDVEVHVRPGDWQSHGHSPDPRYARVIAHVCYFPGPAEAARLPPGAVQIALRAPLKANPVFSFESIDLASYPYAALQTEPSPCARLLRGWTPEQRGALLDAAGEERLRVKAARFAAALREEGAGQALYEGLMSALGYKHNRNAFRRLARVVPLEALRGEAGGDPVQAYAVLMGVAGLLPTRTAPGWDEATRVFVRRLWDAWWKRRSSWEHALLSRSEWRLTGLRPPNHPARRLAAAAEWFVAPRPIEIGLRAVPLDDAADALRDLGRLLRGSGGIPYWTRRLGFGGGVREADVERIGAGRVAAILSNVVVPWLAATGAAVAGLLDRLPAEEDNALIRETAHALFGRDHNPSLYRSGRRQQGLLQVFHDFCLNDRSGCRDCTLPGELAR